MAKFKDIPKQRPPRKVFDLDMPNGIVAKVAIRTLLNADNDAIDAAAVEHARKHKAEHAREGDPIYDRAHMMHTLLLSCSDPDSPDDNPAPFFSSIEEIRTGLDGERTAYLLEAQKCWQETHSGQVRVLKPFEALQKAAEIVGPDGLKAYLEMSPGLRWSIMRALGGYILEFARAEAERAAPPPAGGA